MISKRYIISAGALILFICVMFSGFWIMPKADRQNALSYLSENMHTGMANAPLTQVALGGKTANSNLAQGNQKSVNPAGLGNVVAVGNPLVLFDISAQPLFGKSGISPQFLLLIIFTIPILALFFFYLWDLLKKRRIKNRKN